MTWPANLPNQNLLSFESFADFGSDVADVAGGILRGDRGVLPIGKNVDGDEVDIRRELCKPQPKFPNVGISDGKS